MYKQLINSSDQLSTNMIYRIADGAYIPFDPDNTDYQAFKLQVLNQQPGGAVVEDGDSFSLNTNPDDSILEDADGVKMTINQAKAFVGTLP